MLMDSKLLSSKFRGCLLGALLGDCLGAPYEGEVLGAGAKVVLQKYFDKLEGPHFKAPVKQYTDDTAMTQCIVKSLIEHKHLNQYDLAQRFVKEYFTEPKRGYGEAVVEVFYKLRNSKIKDPIGPAKEQFQGSGSYGNGAAMRVAPVSLFFADNYDNIIEMSKNSAEITHSHKLGVDGAILQAIAIHQSFQIEPNSLINTKEFTEKLIEKMSPIEKDEEGLGLEDPYPYKKQLQLISSLLQKNEVSQDEVIQTLGNSVTALYSVPTAIYCFLRAQSDIAGIKTDNAFRRALQYAISLGGDTDTIASMAGALMGAYHGEEIISSALQQHCENSAAIIKLADELLKASTLS